jgi:cysteine desulfurase
MQKPIYLDYNATTPLDSRVFELMLPFFRDQFGNSASSQHPWGWVAQKATEKARGQVAQLLNTEASEIYFTSGATEGNNWVLQSLFNQFSGNPNEFHILSTKVEHNSILKTLEHLQKLGADIEYVPVNKWGQVEISEIQKRLKPQTRLLSFMWANNEVGSLNPIQEIGELAYREKIYFHSDATAAVGKLAIDLNKTHVDFLTLSAHKIYGPKGVGAVYIRSKDPRIELEPLIHGGGQEKGFRSGTVNTPGVVGFGAACEICRLEMNTETSRTENLRTQFWSNLQQEMPHANLNGHPENRACNNLSITFKGTALDEALPHLMRLGFSMGSACHSGSGKGSHVLKAMGLSDADTASTIRLSLGRYTTPEELSETLILLKKAFSTKPIDINITQ